MSDAERHSHASEAELVGYPELRAEREVQNGLKQFQTVVEMIQYHLSLPTTHQDAMNGTQCMGQPPPEIFGGQGASFVGVSLFSSAWVPLDMTPMSEMEPNSVFNSAEDYANMSHPVLI